MYKPANVKKNLGVGRHAPVVIYPATAEGVKKLMAMMPGLKSVVIQGMEFTPEELVALSETPERPAPMDAELNRQYADEHRAPSPGRLGIRMISTRFNYFPRQFELGGRTLNVTGVLRSDTRGQSFIFHVCCDDGREYVLEHDMDAGTWGLQEEEPRR